MTDSGIGVLLSWSSGKDSAWALKTLMDNMPGRVRALVTTFNESADRVAMHAVRRDLVRRQAAAANLPLIEIDLPWPCSNEQYEERFGAGISIAANKYSARYIAFGDLFLEDIRAYREHQMEQLNLEPIFPIWGENTNVLARKMVENGLNAAITCVDPEQLDPSFAGQSFDHKFLDSLPAQVDPCGENGEFHTFTWAGPMFSKQIDIKAGNCVDRDKFRFADIIPV